MHLQGIRTVVGNEIIPADPIRIVLASYSLISTAENSCKPYNDLMLTACAVSIS
jgi:hypothetical protein